MTVDDIELLLQPNRMQWLELKYWLVSLTGLDRDSLHIYAAVTIQLMAALFFRRSLASPWPWLIVLIAELTNEYYDYRSFFAENGFREALPEDLYRDIQNTMVIPTILLIIARFWPGWLVGKSSKKAPVRDARPQKSGNC